MVFLLSAALFLGAGVVLYFLPPTLLAVTPFWLERVAAALLMAWGLFLLASARRPSGAGVLGLAAGNLLIVATLIPAALSAAVSPQLRTPFYALGALLLLLALLALVLPRGNGRS